MSENVASMPSSITYSIGGLSFTGNSGTIYTVFGSWILQLTEATPSAFVYTALSQTITITNAGTVDPSYILQPAAITCERCDTSGAITFRFDGGMFNFPSLGFGGLWIWEDVFGTVLSGNRVVDSTSPPYGLLGDYLPFCAFNGTPDCNGPGGPGQNFCTGDYNAGLHIIDNGTAVCA